ATDSALAVIDYDRLGSPCFPLLQCLADTDNRRQANLEGSDRLLEYGLVSLPEILAPLAVTDNDVSAADRTDHRTGHLSGVGSFSPPEHVRPADFPAAAPHSVVCGRQIRERRANHDFAVLGSFYQGQKLAEIAGRLRRSLVHFPIARHYWFSTHTIAD